MKAHPETLAAMTERFTVVLGQILDDEEDTELRDFVESISLTEDQLAVFVARPELSLAEARQLFERRQTAPAQGYSADGSVTDTTACHANDR
jgi:hypothetical protein